MKPTHNPETEFVALITTDEDEADRFAEAEANKEHGLPVRIAKVGKQFHVIVRHKE